MRHIMFDYDDEPVDLTALFARIPDDVVLRVSTRDLNLYDGQTCLCGWALREKLAELRNCDASAVLPYEEDPMPSITQECSVQFGGDEDDWEAVFSGVQYSYAVPAIERAWVQRLDKAVRRS